MGRKAFIVPSPLPADRAVLQKMTVVQLKAELRKRGAKVGGVKGELIDRLLGCLGGDGGGGAGDAAPPRAAPVAAAPSHTIMPRSKAKAASMQSSVYTSVPSSLMSFSCSPKNDAAMPASPHPSSQFRAAPATDSDIFSFGNASPQAAAPQQKTTMMSFYSPAQRSPASGSRISLSPLPRDQSLLPQLPQLSSVHPVARPVAAHSTGRDAGFTFATPSAPADVSAFEPRPLPTEIVTLVDVAALKENEELDVNSFDARSTDNIKKVPFVDRVALERAELARQAALRADSRGRQLSASAPEPATTGKQLLCDNCAAEIGIEDVPSYWPLPFQEQMHKINELRRNDFISADEYALRVRQLNVRLEFSRERGGGDKTTRVDLASSSPAALSLEALPISAARSVISALDAVRDAASPQLLREAMFRLAITVRSNKDSIEAVMCSRAVDRAFELIGVFLEEEESARDGAALQDALLLLCALAEYSVPPSVKPNPPPPRFTLTPEQLQSLCAVFQSSAASNVHVSVCDILALSVRHKHLHARFLQEVSPLTLAEHIRGASGRTLRAMVKLLSSCCLVDASAFSPADWDAIVPLAEQLLSHSHDVVRAAAAGCFEAVAGAEGDAGRMSDAALRLIVGMVLEVPRATRVLGELAYSDDNAVAQRVVDAGALPMLVALLSSDGVTETVESEALWLASNLMSGTAVQCAAVVDAGMVQEALRILRLERALPMVHNEACHVVFTALEAERSLPAGTLDKINDCVPIMQTLIRALKRVAGAMEADGKQLRCTNTLLAAIASLLGVQNTQNSLSAFASMRGGPSGESPYTCKLVSEEEWQLARLHLTRLVDAGLDNKHLAKLLQSL